MMIAAMLLAVQADVKVPTEQGRCRARPAEVLVGETYRRKVPTRAKALSGARTVRVIWPGQVVTADYREDRLNLNVDRNRTITAVRCG
jgi:hypothetical protein